MLDDRLSVEQAGEGLEESGRADQAERRYVSSVGLADFNCLGHAASTIGSSPASRV